MGELMELAGFTEDLKNCSKGPFTFFATNNARWSNLSPRKLEKLRQPEYRETLVQLMSHHLVEGLHLVADAKNGDVMTSMEGSNITWYIKGHGSVNKVEPRLVPAKRKNGAWINKPRDIVACNGILHKVTSILLPDNFDLIRQGEAFNKTEVAASNETEGLAWNETEGNLRKRKA